MLFKRAMVNKNERGLLLRNGDFQRVLRPGTHWLFGGVDALTVETFALERPAFTHALASYLMAKEPAVVDAEFLRVDLAGTQVGLRRENGVLVEVLAPATRRLYWHGLVDVQVDVIDISATAEVPAGLVEQFMLTSLRENPGAGLDGVLQVQVPEHGAGILWIDGKVQPLLVPGSYAFWQFNRNVSVTLVDLRLQVTEVSGQEILTRDKVALRLNLSATWSYGDPITAHTHLQNPTAQLYRELQLGLRAAVGTRTLDELLDDKTLIDEVVMAHVQERLAKSGIELENVGVKDIILPGEMKDILAQLVEAEKEAQANAIRRREETGATRSLLNTARVMEGNPIALRLKELETLERVAENIDRISVFGGFDSLLNGSVKLR